MDSKSVLDEVIDVTLPGKKFSKGSLHVLSKSIEEMEEILGEIRALVCMLPANNEDDASYDECLDDSGHLTHLGESICDAAYRRGININAFRDYEAAKAELQRFPYKYMAIILDICDETAIDGNTHDSFLKMGRFLQTHRALYNQQEPYVFNLSGVEKYWADDQMILKEEYTTKKVYEKPDDINLLMQDIILKL